MKPHVLLIGASGFIGQHLIKSLGDSCELWQIDKFTDQTDHSVTVDLLDPGSSELIKEQLPDIHFQVILYLTNISNRYVPPSLTVEEANNLALSNLLNGLTIKADKFGFFSSAYVYKNPESGQKITEDSPIEPTSPYGKLKTDMESQITVWGEKRGIPISIFRPEWVYGSGDTTKKLIPELCRAAVSLQPYLVKVNPQETRQPIFISDLINSINKWMITDITNPKDVFLLVGPEPVTQMELLKVAQQNSSMANNPKVEFVSPSNQSLNYAFDNAKTREILNWNPEISPKVGMERLITYLKEVNS